MRDVLDVATTLVGLFVLSALAWAVLQGGYSWSAWQVPAVVGTIGVLLALPFERVRKLSRLARDLLPFG